MSRLVLAIRAFWAILLARPLPDELAPRPLLDVTPPPAQLPPTPAPAPAASTDDAAVQLLALLQREGRLVDFLQEDITAYADAQIGAAVRDIHKGCKKALAECLAVEPVLPAAENATVEVAKGFDPSAIRVIGNVTGEPPWKGTLKHHGWRTRHVKMPQVGGQHDPLVIAPAEVEL